MVVPDLGGIDAMPFGDFAETQQIIDRGRDRAPVRISEWIAEGLAEIAAFRMRLQIKPRDHVFGGKPANGMRHILQPLFFHSRKTRNTASGTPPASPTASATAGSCTRRNGLVAFSSPIVVIPNRSPACARSCASRARSTSAALCGSTLSAKRALARV